MSNYEPDTQSPLAVEVTSRSDAALSITIRGEVDLANATLLTTKLIDAVNSHPTGNVIIDAAAMPFLDAAGITAFVAVYRHAATRQRDVRLVNVRPVVSRVLHVVELADLFHLIAKDPDT